jgi:hypothetical protein
MATVGRHLEGIQHLYPDGTIEWAFHPERFRPVTERPTDTTIFKKVAASVLCGAETATQTTATGNSAPTDPIRCIAA